MHTYLACFDISDDKQRRYVSRKLEHYGLRVQYSVFEISVSNREELDNIKQELEQYLDTFDDLRFYHLCSSCRKLSSRQQNKPIAEYPMSTVV